MTRSNAIVLACVITAVAALGAQQPDQAAKPAAPSLSDQFPGLEFRNIGPFRGGRVTAVAGLPDEPLVYYFGATGGGLWKTADGGATWKPLADKFLKTSSVGAVAIAESDPNVIFAGMGQAPIRGNTSHGDGVYKSTDAGATWTNVGLQDTQQISRVRIHPKDPDTRLCRRAGPRVGAERRPGRLSHRRRRQDVEEGAVRRRQDRGVGPHDGSDEPAHPLRRVLAGLPPAVVARERRARRRPLEVHRRRRHLEEAHHRPARGRRRQGHRGGVGVAAISRLGDGAARGQGRPLPE